MQHFFAAPECSGCSPDRQPAIKGCRAAAAVQAMVCDLGLSQTDVDRIVESTKGVESEDASTVSYHALAMSAFAGGSSFFGAEARRTLLVAWPCHIAIMLPLHIGARFCQISGAALLTALSSGLGTSHHSAVLTAMHLLCFNLCMTDQCVAVSTS